MPRAYPRRSPSWTKNFCFRAGYMAINALFLTVLYAIESSILFVPPPRGISSKTSPPRADASVESLLWGACFVSWVAYFWVQGSSPGYLEPNSALEEEAVLSTGTSDPSTGEIRNASSSSSSSSPISTGLGGGITTSSSSSSTSLTRDSASGTGLENDGDRDRDTHRGAAAIRSAANISLTIDDHDGESFLASSSSSSSSSASARTRFTSTTTSSSTASVTASNTNNLNLNNNTSDAHHNQLHQQHTPAVAQHEDDETDSSVLLRSNRPQNNNNILLVHNEDIDYDPELASDPVGTALEAAQQADRGWRKCKWCAAKAITRSHHCRECDKCVALFDHHCGVINTCIGERNHTRFWFFLGAQSFTLTVVIGILNTSFIWRRSTSDWIGTNAIVLVSLCVLWLCQLFVFGLFVFHTWLGFTNTTTYETTVGAAKLWYLAGTEPRDCDLPFSRGTCTNLRLFCCLLDDGCNPGRWSCCGRNAQNKSGNRGDGNGGGGGGGSTDAVAGGNNDPTATTTGNLQSNNNSSTSNNNGWKPKEWERAQHIDRESTDICRNMWENRYWSCC